MFFSSSSGRIAQATVAALSVSVLGVFVGQGAFAAPQSPPASPTPAPKTVTLSSDGQTRTVSSTAATVGDLLREQQATLDTLDRCSAPVSAPLTSGQQIVVTRVSYEKVIERAPLPHPVVRRYNPRLRPGTVVVKQKGAPGERVAKFAEVRKNGVLVSRKQVGGFVTAPRPHVVVVGTRGGGGGGRTVRPQLASRGFFNRFDSSAGGVPPGAGRVLTMVATGYYGPRCGGSGITRIGLRARRGIVAVDPRVIPLRKRLYIEGYGYAIAGDTGGAIKGRRIDLAFNTWREASRHGYKRVRVFVLN